MKKVHIFSTKQEESFYESFSVLVLQVVQLQNLKRRNLALIFLISHTNTREQIVAWTVVSAVIFYPRKFAMKHCVASKT